MTQFIITTESGSDLTPDLKEKLNVYTIPMHMSLGDNTYPDGTIPVTDIFNYYEETGSLPKTSGTTPQDNEDVFQQIFAQYPDAVIIHIAYSAATTVSYNSARIAAENFENVYLVDAKHLSFSLTAVIKAVRRFIDEHPNITAEEVVKYVEDVRERTQFQFLPQTLTYLQAGGRVSSTSVFAAKLLKIYPAIHMEDGLLKAGKKYRGSFRKAVTKLIRNFFNSFDSDPETLIVGCSPGFSEEDKQFVYQLLAEYGYTDVPWMVTGSVISSHGGPGGFGITGIETNDAE